MLFLLAGTIVMIYSVVLHIALPSIPAIAVAIAFGVIIMLFLFTLLAYFLDYGDLTLVRTRKAERSQKNQRLEGDGRDSKSRYGILRIRGLHLGNLMEMVIWRSLSPRD
jgi:hypothetical protein